MRLMLLREFREGWRSFRLPGIFLLALFFALLEPPTNKYMDALLGMFAEGIVINMPPSSPEAAYLAFGNDLVSIVLIAAIIVTMGIVAREQQNGLAAWFLTRPVSRNSYLFAKVVYLIISTGLIIAFTSIICALYTQTLIGSLNPAGVVLATILLITQLLLPLMVTYTVSATTGIAGAAAGAGIVTIFLMSLLGWLLQKTAIDWLPMNLSQHLPQVIAGNATNSFWAAILTTWGVIVVLICFTQAVFNRKQI